MTLHLARFVLPLLSFIGVVGGGAELAVSKRLQQDFNTNQKLCKYYLCDNVAVAWRTYDLQVKGDAASMAIAVQVFQGALARDPASAP